MPELPDMVILARSMDEALRGWTIATAEVNQPKCLNVSVEEFCRDVAGIGNVYVQDILWHAGPHPLRPPGRNRGRAPARRHPVRAAGRPPLGRWSRGTGRLG